MPAGACTFHSDRLVVVQQRTLTTLYPSTTVCLKTRLTTRGDSYTDVHLLAEQLPAVRNSIWVRSINHGSDGEPLELWNIWVSSVNHGSDAAAHWPIPGKWLVDVRCINSKLPDWSWTFLQGSAQENIGLEAIPLTLINSAVIGIGRNR